MQLTSKGQAKIGRESGGLIQIEKSVTRFGFSNVVNYADGFANLFFPTSIQNSLKLSGISKKGESKLIIRQSLKKGVYTRF